MPSFKRGGILFLSTVGSKLSSISKELHPLCIVECSVDDGSLYHPKFPGFAHNIGGDSGACAWLVPMVRELREGPWGGRESRDVEKETTLA